MVKTFKEILRNDINQVFLNPDEFGEIHTIDGRQMVCMIDENEVIERSKKQVEKGRIDGIYERQIMLYVAREQFGRMPAIGASVTIDSGKYRVADVTHEAGIYSILLGAVRS